MLFTIISVRGTGKKVNMSTQFGDMFCTWGKICKATMSIQSKPGETLGGGDWVGTTVEKIDCFVGEITPAYLFVAVLSCNSYTYVELCQDMKTENYIQSH